MSKNDKHANDTQTARKVWESACNIVGEKVPFDMEANLFDLGVDSLGMAELVIQVEEAYGEGSISIDDVLASPILGEIAAKIVVKGGTGGVTSAPALVQTLKPKPVATKTVASEAARKTDPMPRPEVKPTVAAKPSAQLAAAPMRADHDWIKTTHVGSLPRFADDGNLTPSAIIAQQKAVGLDMINDGEWSRDNYITDLLSRIDGIGSDGSICEMPCATDMHDVPVFSQRFTGGNAITERQPEGVTLNPKRAAHSDMACLSAPKYAADGVATLMEKVGPFVDALKEAGYASDGFWTVPSPGALALFCEDRYFNDPIQLVQALAEAVRPEYEAIAATGLMLQIDCPDLAMGRHTRHANLSDAEFLALADVNVAALNDSLRSIDPSQVRANISWGGYAGPHHHDIEAKTLWPTVARINAKYIMIEAANSRHEHEVPAFAKAVASGLFDSTKVIVPGVIDTTAARVEHVNLVAERILRWVRAVGHPSRVIASPDSGFMGKARIIAITADVAWRKLGALVEGAALATKLYLEAHAPVPMAAPSLAPTPFRAAIFVGAAPDDVAAGCALAAELSAVRASTVDVLPADGGGGIVARAAEAFAALRSAVDFPVALIAVGDGSSGAVAARTAELLRADQSASRRPSTVFVCGAGAYRVAAAVDAGDAAQPEAVAALVAHRMLSDTGFDKRALAPQRHEKPLPSAVDVVVVGGGLLGMVQAKRLLDAGLSVAVLEQRALVGGIWSMYANSTSQVNSSEGGYCLKEFLPDNSPRRHAHNRDHSTAAEVLKDLSELGASLCHVIYTEVQVVRVVGANGDYNVVATQYNMPGGNATGEAATAVISAKGVVMAINDRVGMPRPLNVPGMDAFRTAGGVVGDGTSDALRGVDWRGKRVAIFGMGAFAVENVRTALEHGAAHVTVVARRLGTICPKMIDYLNFVKPWDENYRHDTGTNVKQMKCWRTLYNQSGSAQPEVWPTKIKHDGHTISVSDIWFIASHLGMLDTKVGTLERMDKGGCVLSDGSFVECDVAVGCIGFERNTTFCEQLTGRSEVLHSNYLDKNLMYLADAEIDENAFNSFFGSSVLEYAKFFTRVYVEGFLRPEKLGPHLWGDAVPTCPVKDRKWTQYIAVGADLIANDETIKDAVAEQVKTRTEHFYRTMPPQTFLEVNRREWEELHTRLNGGVPLPASKMLPYPFPDAPSWCAPAEEVLGAYVLV